MMMRMMIYSRWLFVKWRFVFSMNFRTELLGTERRDVNKIEYIILSFRSFLNELALVELHTLKYPCQNQEIQ